MSEQEDWWTQNWPWVTLTMVGAFGPIIASVITILYDQSKGYR